MTVAVKDKLRVLVFSTVFPSPADPLHGQFVLERVRALAPRARVRIVAPVAWRTWRKLGTVRAEQAGLSVWHPTFLYVPGALRTLHGLFLFLSSLACVRRLWRDETFDLIDAHFAYPEGFAAVLLGRWFGRPVTVTLRGTEIPMRSDPLRSWLAGWALRRADRIIAVSRPLAERAVELGVAPGKVTVIGNGVDPGRFRPVDRAEARRRLGVPADARLVVSVGHLCRRKGFHRLIEVWPELRAAAGAVSLAIVGGPGKEGDEHDALARMIAERGLQDCVRLVGPQPPDQVMLWLNAADLFVLASSFEGSPNVVCEAWACGCPVVVTAVGDLAHAVSDDIGIVSGPAEDHGALLSAMTAALRRDWDRHRIRYKAEARPWSTVADEVIVEWRGACGMAQGERHEAAYS